MTKVPLNEAVETLAATIRAVGVSSEEAAKAAQEFATLLPPFTIEDVQNYQSHAKTKSKGGTETWKKEMIF